MAKRIRNVAGLAVLFAAGVAAATADSVAQKASALVVGSITTRTETNQSVTFDLTIERVLAGAVSPGQVIRISHAWARQGIASLSSPRVDGAFYGIWALTGPTGGAWDVLPVRSPGGVIVSLFWGATRTPPSFYQTIPISGVQDTIILNVAAAAEVAGGGAEDAYSAMGDSSSPAAIAVLERFAGLSTPFNSIGVAGLLDRQAPDAFTQFLRVWPAISVDPSASYVLTSLREAYRNADPASVQQFVGICRSTASSALRGSCVHALASIHTQGTIPFLGSLLSSADPQEVGQAVFGISSFVNGCPAQTRDNVVSMAYLQCGAPTPYKNSETVANFGIPLGPAGPALIQYWRTWWGAHPDLH